MVQHGIGHRFRNASLAQSGGKGPAEVVPGPARDSAAILAPPGFSRFGECSLQGTERVHGLAGSWRREHQSLAARRLVTLAQHNERQRMKVQPMRIAVLRQLARLSPLGGIEIKMRPVQSRRLVTPAWDCDQEAREVAADRRLKPPSGPPEPGEFCRSEIVRTRLRWLGPTLAGDLRADIDLDVSNVVAPIQEAREGTEALAGNSAARREQFPDICRRQFSSRYVDGPNFCQCQPDLSNFLSEVIGGWQANTSHLRPLR